MYKRIYLLDENNQYVKDIYINENDPLPEHTTDVFLPNGFFKAKFVDGSWVEDMSPDDIDRLMGNDLAGVKTQKMKELGIECNKAILGRFTADVDGVTYQFSCDDEAQKNFDKGLKAFEKGWMSELMWTAYDADGNITRLALNPTNFEPVYIAHLNHIQGNISKLRDTLQPKVEAATTKDEVFAIVY